MKGRNVERGSHIPTPGWVVPPAPQSSRAGAGTGAWPTAELLIRLLSGKLKMSSFFCG